MIFALCISFSIFQWKNLWKVFKNKAEIFAEFCIKDIFLLIDIGIYMFMHYNEINLESRRRYWRMQVERQGETLRVDIHGMRCEEAKERLLWLFGHQCKGIKQVTVIHGYRSGQALRDMVRTLRHPRISKRVLSLNDGETIFFLNGKENASARGKDFFRRDG